MDNRTDLLAVFEELQQQRAGRSVLWLRGQRATLDGVAGQREGAVLLPVCVQHVVGGDVVVGLRHRHADTRLVRYDRDVDDFAHLGQLVEVLQRLVREDHYGLHGACVSGVLREILLEEGLGLHGDDALPLGLLHTHVVREYLFVQLVVFTLCM